MLRFFKFGKQGRKNSGNAEGKEDSIRQEAEEYVAKEIAKRLSNSISTSVKEIMIPRIDMTTISLVETMSKKDLIALIKKSGHSRIPVWENSVDDIVGILYVKDLFHLLIEGAKVSFSLKQLLRPPFFIPESTSIFSLLKEFQKKKVHLAVVVDEYGGVSGIVALEDVLEEIVGEIRDEHDKEEGELIEKISSDVYKIDPRASIEELNNKLNIKLPDKQSDTVGGFMFDLFGRIPNKNEAITYKEGDRELTFQILNIEGNRIHKIKMTSKVSDASKEEKDTSIEAKSLPPPPPPLPPSSSAS